MVLKISVPPEVSWTQAVSGCSASLVATVGADPGAQRMRTAQSDRPEALGVELADHPHDPTVEQPAVAAGDGLLGGSEDLGQPTERRSGIEVEGLDDSSVQPINRGRFHATDPSTQW